MLMLFLTIFIEPGRITAITQLAAVLSVVLHNPEEKS